MLLDLNLGIIDDKRNTRKCSGLNWDALKNEFTWEKIWKDRSEKYIAKNLAIVFLLGLLPTVFDLATDTLSIRDFIAGTVYVKHINNMVLLGTNNTMIAHSLTTFPNPLTAT